MLPFRPACGSADGVIHPPEFGVASFRISNVTDESSVVLGDNLEQVSIVFGGFGLAPPVRRVFQNVLPES